MFTKHYTRFIINRRYYIIDPDLKSGSIFMSKNKDIYKENKNLIQENKKLIEENEKYKSKYYSLRNITHSCVNIALISGGTLGLTIGFLI